ncbi:MAG: 3,4-dihydroxyphenylacetate 2,3-dioxygenase [Chloroflexota bacterium]
MPNYQINFDPPFNIVRLSHLEWIVTDLAYSKAYYVDLVGYHLEEETADSLYLRGMEELNHHSLILCKGDTPKVSYLAFKVFSEEDLDRAYDYFESLGQSVAWVERYKQGRTLKTTDPFGVPLELYYEMERAEDILQKYHLYHGARIQRIDHFNLFHHDVNAATEFYVSQLGFRVTEATVIDKSDPDSPYMATWMHRKGTVHDIAFTNGLGPRLHHVGVWMPSIQDIIHLCDSMASAGLRGSLERGPGRHGIANAFFLYIRDQDGHRLEPYVSDYQTVDPDHPARVWNLHDPMRQTLWGQAAPRSWFELGSEFEGLTPQPAKLTAKPIIAPE